MHIKPVKRLRSIKPEEGDQNLIYMCSYSSLDNVSDGLKKVLGTSMASYNGPGVDFHMAYKASIMNLQCLKDVIPTKS